MRLSVLTADDEPHARRHIKQLLSKDEDVEVIYECKNGSEVLNFLSTKEPNILFLDINMPGLSGIEVASKIKSTSSLIIFSTAYDQYALKAFELEAFDYLLKPYGDKRFREVLQRAKSAIEKTRQAKFSQKFADLYNDYNQTITPYLKEFVIKERGFEKIIKVNEVLFIEASAVYAELHLKAKKILHRASLNFLEKQLPPNFTRVHRSYIINNDFIKSCKYLNNSTYIITLDNDDKIISSRKYKEMISKQLVDYLK